MALPSRQSPRVNRDFLDFIETAQYNPPSGSHPTGSASQDGLPRGWRQYQHPIGDIYFHHHGLRLTTAEDIRDAEVRGYVLDAREDHLQSVAGDPAAAARLPPDVELVVADVSAASAVLRMYSRRAGAVFHFAEEEGLRAGMQEEFWSHVAEFPAHHRELPPHAEARFVQSLRNAKAASAAGALFCFTEGQIDKIIARYQELTALRAQGRTVTPALAWLIGVVMPLEPMGREVGGHNVDHILNGGYH